MADALSKLVLTSSGEAALATADLVVEAITENLPLKQEHRDHALKFFSMEVDSFLETKKTTVTRFPAFYFYFKRFGWALSSVLQTSNV